MWISGCDRALQVLGASNAKTIEEIKSIYKKLVIQYHPDNSPENAVEYLTKIQDINFAYDYLKKNFRADENHTGIPYDFEQKNENEQNIQKNEKAFHSRRCYGGENFYCWDPEYEDYRRFSTSIWIESDKMLREIKNKYFGDIYGYGQVTQPIDFCDSDIRLKLNYLMKCEFIKPYFCLCKQISMLTQKNDLLEQINILPTELGKSYEKFSEATIEIELSGTMYENRTDNIEKRAKEGDEVILCCFGDDPRYPEKIEVFTRDGYSVGTIPAGLAFCISPLVLAGKMDIAASIKKIQTRKMKSKHARKADIFIDLNVKILEQIENEKFPICSEKIKQVEDEYSQLCESVKSTIIHYPFEKDIFEIGNCNLFKRCHKILEIKGTYGQLGEDRNAFYCITRLDILSIESKDLRGFIINLIDFMTDGRRIKQIMKLNCRYGIKRDGVSICIKLKPIRNDIIEVCIQGYSDGLYIATL